MSNESVFYQLAPSSVLLPPYRLGNKWSEGQWAQVWHDLLEAQKSGLTDQLPADDLAVGVLRALLLTQQYQLAVQFLPRQQGGTPLGGTPKAAAAVDGNAGGAFAFHLQQQQQQHDYDAVNQQLVAADAAAAEEAAAAAAAGLRGLPSSAEAALAALTGSSSSSSSRFGVRKALHTAAGAAVGRSARLMGVGAGVIGSTAHLVGSTAQAVSSTGGLVGTTAGLVSGTASFVSSAATLAAAAAAKAGGAAASSVVLRGAQGVLSAAAAEGVVVGVSQVLLSSAAAVDDPAIREAEAVLALLPEACEVRLGVLGHQD